MLFYLKLAVIFFYFALVSIAGIILSVIFWGSTNANHYFAVTFSPIALRILGIRVTVRNPERLDNQPCIYLANHQSSMDLLVFSMCYPKRTILVGKKELKWIPFFGIYYVAAGNIGIDREKGVSSITALSKVADRVKNTGTSIWIFPEGTRNRSGNGILPLKRGAFHIATQAGVPVVPIVVESYQKLGEFKPRTFKGGDLMIQILEPIHTKDLNSAEGRKLPDTVRNRMLEALRGPVS